VSHPVVEITSQLAEDVAPLDFVEPVTDVYNPLVYAQKLHDAYLERFATDSPREILLVGMNPGPWGMAQTGVPFGDVDFVGDWMGLDAPVGKPAQEHPKRPIDGLDCPRNEVSGSRLWGWARDRFGEPEAFFERFFVYNYCPLLFLEDSGRNRTPNRLKADERRALFPHCDRALRELVVHLKPTYVIGVGAFATRRVKAALAELDTPAPTIGRILHPSPASPKANRGWAEQAEAELRDIGVDL
jgi:single-strand selective monofunctional uracil DNA glycosylase